MTPAQWERLRTLFQSALDQPKDARRAWLDQACGGDAALAREALALLDSHETIGTFLEQSPEVDPADLDTLPAGMVVGNHYRIVEEIGRGGMGVVYLAEDLHLGRRVAVKALPLTTAANPDMRARLKHEAQAAARISHRSIATVHALEELDDHLLLVSEYVPGETLRSEIDRGPVPRARALRIATDVATALHAAHQARVVHRDLKPENVLITPDNDVKVVDFGIARAEGTDVSRLTRTGAMLGTPAYMAPEQLLGAAADHRADIYALGVILSEMLSGRHPLRHRLDGSGADANHHLLPAGLQTVIARCMQPDPSARYASAREVLEALEQQRDTGEAPMAVPGATRERRAHLWWWEFHQAVVALIYWLMAIPAWQARAFIGGTAGRAFFIAMLVAIIITANLRFHLWFTSRFYPAELSWVRGREEAWIRGADIALTAGLVSGGLLIGEKNSPLAVLMLAVGIGAAVGFMWIEPVTRRAAFKHSPARE